MLLPRKTLLVALSILSLVGLAATAAASTWCGKNGVLRLSFTEGEELTQVQALAPDQTGLTTVELYAILADREPVAHEGEQFLTIGGFELMLVVEGAEPIFKSEVFPEQSFNMSRVQGACRVGIFPGQAIQPQGTTLAHWTLLFAGEVANVKFSLEADWCPSCPGLVGCLDSQTYALYTGTPDAKMSGMMFGAGYAPAYLNWADQPALEAVAGQQTWAEVGVFKAPE